MQLSIFSKKLAVARNWQKVMSGDSQRETLLALAKLAEQAERYEGESLIRALSRQGSTAFVG